MTICFCRFFLIATCLASCVGGSWLLAAERPNIVYILADDLGYGDVQSLNPQRGKIKTLHLDRLASQGKVFTDAHSGSSVCTPTRYGLLTGRYAWRTRLQSGVLDGGNDDPLIAEDRLTVASFLKQHGYKTACIGKWHLGFQSSAQTAKEQGSTKSKTGGLPLDASIIGGPTTRGFDSFFGCSNARTMSSLIEDEKVIEIIEPMTMLPRIGKKAVSFVEEHAASKSGKPFFLYFPLTSPHTPIVPTPEWQGKSGLGDYGDFVMMTDAIVGELLDALDKTKMSNDTLVFFTSDNGCSPAAGTPKLEQQGHFASERARGYKADIWDGGHRVPFIVRWPNKIQAGSKSDQTICHVDFIATCAEILGAKLPVTAAEDSVSILPALLGDVSQPLREAVVHHSISGRFAIRQGEWKLSFCSGSGGWAKPGDAEATQQGLPDVQLYNMVNDPSETRNLQAEQPEVVARLTGLLQKYVDEGRSTLGPTTANDVKIRPFGNVSPRKNKKERKGTKS